MPFCSYSLLSNVELDGLVKSIKEQQPSTGQKMMMGHLRSRGVNIQRRRLESSLKRIDAEGRAVRRHAAIPRRCYSVPSPNYIWHIDGTHKLVRWKLVVHACIDGYSRFVPYCHCSTNNKATTVLDLFLEAVAKYGRPLKIRSDQGGENALVWRYMLETHLNSDTLIIGSSVHNQRIERFNRDINTQVLNYYVNLFMEMEQNDLLDPENETDLFVLHKIFLPVINKKLENFVDAFNNHPLSTERNFSPKQLFILYKGLLQHQSLNPSKSLTLADIAYPNRLSYVEVREPSLSLNAAQLLELDNLMVNYSSATEIRLYKLASEFVAECLRLI